MKISYIYLAATLLLTAMTADAKTPEQFNVKFATTKGDVLLTVHRSWAPLGADRFYELVKSGYYNDVAFFRVIGGFMAQFGISGDPKVTAKWKNANIKDDKAAGHANTRGMISFATAGPNTRTTQLFINYGDNSRLDGMGFTPFGKVTKGMETIDKLYNGYGESPSQGEIEDEGNAYLKKDFPKLDYIKTAVVVK